MTRRRKKLLVVLVVGALLAMGLLPFSTKVDDDDRAHIVSHALDAVINDKRVLAHWHYRKLLDCRWIDNDGRLYFENKLGIPDTIFLERGLKPVPTERELSYDAGEKVIGFSYQDIEGNQTEHIQFYYVFGNLGAQGYEIRMYRSLLMEYFVYIHQWVS